MQDAKKVVLKEEMNEWEFVLFYNNDDDGWFVSISRGADCSLGNEKSNAWDWNLSQGFDGIEDDTLTGKPSCERFACSHPVSIPLE